jgi:hypothetical protein
MTFESLSFVTALDSPARPAIQCRRVGPTSRGDALAVASGQQNMTRTVASISRSIKAFIYFAFIYFDSELVLL